MIQRRRFVLAVGPRARTLFDAVDPIDSKDPPPVTLGGMVVGRMTNLIFDPVSNILEVEIVLELPEAAESLGELDAPGLRLGAT